MVNKSDSGTIKAGEKSATVNKESVPFMVPNDITYKYSWDDIEASDFALESEHVKADEIVSAVNTVRKNTARQTAYMAAIAPYKPDTMTPEQRVEKAVQNLILAGVPEELARQNIKAMLG